MKLRSGKFKMDRLTIDENQDESLLQCAQVENFSDSFEDEQDVNVDANEENRIEVAYDSDMVGERDGEVVEGRGKVGQNSGEKEMMKLIREMFASNLDRERREKEREEQKKERQIEKKKLAEEREERERKLAEEREERERKLAEERVKEKREFLEQINQEFARMNEKIQGCTREIRESFKGLREKSNEEVDEDSEISNQEVVEHVVEQECVEEKENIIGVQVDTCLNDIVKEISGDHISQLPETESMHGEIVELNQELALECEIVNETVETVVSEGEMQEKQDTRESNEDRQCETQIFLHKNESQSFYLNNDDEASSDGIESNNSESGCESDYQPNDRGKRNRQYRRTNRKRSPGNLRNQGGLLKDKSTFLSAETGNLVNRNCSGNSKRKRRESDNRFEDYRDAECLEWDDRGRMLKQKYER